jgi:hypothetical protein
MSADKNQGEGDREAARRYNEHASEFATHGDVTGAAEDARDAIDSNEGPHLREAEERGKKPARLSFFERLRAAFLRTSRRFT